eukprot:6405441-Amphidinium_carterae.1
MDISTPTAGGGGLPPPPAARGSRQDRPTGAALLLLARRQDFDGLAAGFDPAPRLAFPAWQEVPNVLVVSHCKNACRVVRRSWEGIRKPRPHGTSQGCRVPTPLVSQVWPGPSLSERQEKLQ